MPPVLRLLACLAILAAPAIAQEPVLGSGGEGRGGGPAAPVAVAPATVGPLPVEVPGNGTAEAMLVISVRARVDGQVERVHVQEGDVVRAGQVLFTLDARTSQALLAQQQAGLERDRAQLTRARLDAQRYASLQSGAFASAQRLEQAQAEANAMAATARASEALLEQTQLAVEFATIRAEVAGRLGALPVKAGNFVRASEGVVLATVTQTDPILVTFSVPERWLAELRAAQGRGEVPKVRARAPEDTGPPAEGELVFVDSAVDPTTGTIRLKARFGNGQSRFWPGQYLEVVLLPRQDPQALSVPAASVRTGPQGAFLFAVRPDGTARRVAVKVLRYAAGRAVLEAELADGERVVTEGQQRLQDGGRVSVREPAGRGARTADAARTAGGEGAAR